MQVSASPFAISKHNRTRVEHHEQVEIRSLSKEYVIESLVHYPRICRYFTPNELQKHIIVYDFALMCSHSQGLLNRMNRITRSIVDSDIFSSAILTIDFLASTRVYEYTIEKAEFIRIQVKNPASPCLQP